MCLVISFGTEALFCRQQLRSSDPPTAVEKLHAEIAEGQKQREKGDFKRALDAFTRASTIAHQIGPPDLEAKALVLTGNCQVRLFQYSAALTSSEAARQLALQVGDNSLAGAAAVTLSTIYAQLGDSSLAEKAAGDSIWLLERSANTEFLARALLNFASIQFASGEGSAARRSSDRAIELAKKLGLVKLEAMAWDYRGTSLLLAGNAPEAGTALKAAFAIRTKIHDVDGLALSEEHQAELELKRGNYLAALRLIDEAFASESVSFRTSPRYYPIHIRACILLKLERTSEALAEFRRAVDAATEWRRDALPGDATSLRTVARLDEVYRDYVQVAANLALKTDNTNLAREALKTLAENRAANLRAQLDLAWARHLRLPPRFFELLSEMQAMDARMALGENTAKNTSRFEELTDQLSNLENELGIAALSSTRQEPRNQHKDSVAEIQLRLRPEEILLSFSLGEEKSFLWAITRDSVNLYGLAAQAEIETRCKAFSEKVKRGQDAKKLGFALSRILFGQLSSSAWRKTEWLVVGDGILWSAVPFCVLSGPTSDPGSPLIRDRTLRLLFSELSLLSPEPATPRRRFVGVGDPIYNRADSRLVRGPIVLSSKDEAISLARLAGSGPEVVEAAKLSGLPETQLLLGAQASGAVLRGALEKTTEILHFAVHIVSPPGRPEKAGLALSLTDDQMPELLTPDGVVMYHVPGSLIILSGCSSQQGQIVPGAGIVGLGRAWLLAGASAVVVSAWPTPDDNGEFFAAFYTHFRRLKSGPLAMRAAAALQAAQLDMQRSTGYRRSPSFWAAYSIVSVR